MKLNFGQTLPLTTELAAIERLKNQCIMLWPIYHLQFGFIIFILAGYKTIYASLDALEFLESQTLACGISWYWASGKIPIEFQWENCCDHFSALILKDFPDSCR